MWEKTRPLARQRFVNSRLCKDAVKMYGEGLNAESRGGWWLGRNSKARKEYDEGRFWMCAPRASPTRTLLQASLSPKATRNIPNVYELCKQTWYSVENVGCIIARTLALQNHEISSFTHVIWNSTFSRLEVQCSLNFRVDMLKLRTGEHFQIQIH